MLIVVEIDRIHLQQFVKRSIDTNLPVLKLSDQDLDLSHEGWAAFHNWKELLVDKDGQRGKFLFKMYVVLSDLLMQSK